MPDATSATIPHRWHEEGTAYPPLPEKRAAWRRKLFIVLLAFQVMVGVLAALLAWLRPFSAPYFDPIWVTEYESSNLPLNALAGADRQLILESSLFPRVSDDAFGSQERQLLIQELAGLRLRQASEPVVVYLCALASVGDKGEVMVLPADANPDDRRTWLALQEVLRHLQECPTRQKLLILDIMRPTAAARRGQLSNDVAARIPAELAAVPDPHRLVLCTCSPGQVSLNAEGLSHSIFAYYLDQGLRGWADGYDSARRCDGRVSVLDLAQFVRLRVDRWAMRNRQTRQTPVLYGTGVDFALRALPHGRPIAATALNPVPDYPPWLELGWKLRDQWWADATFQHAPLLFRELEFQVLRAEEAWRGGVDPDRVQQDLRESVEAVQRKRTSLLTVGGPPPRSLAFAAAEGATSDAKLTQAMRDLTTKFGAQTASLKATEADKTKEKLASDFLEKNKEATTFALSWAAIEIAGAEPIPPVRTLDFLDYLLRLRSPQPIYVETRFLHLLAGLPNWADLGAMAQLALHVVRQGELAASRAEAFPWVRGLLDTAAQKRHEGEVLFLAQGFAPQNRANQLLHEAANEYAILAGHQDALSQARRAVDEAMAFLPAYGDYIQLVPRTEAAWHSATVQASKLFVALRLPHRATPLTAAELATRSEALRQQTAVLRQSLDDLRVPFRADSIVQLQKLCATPNAPAALYHQVQAILSTPFGTAENRAALWQAGVELARRQDEAVIKLDNEDDRRQVATPPLASYGTDQELFEQRERDQALRRARVSIALLRLGGLDPESVKTLETELNEVNEKPSETSLLGTLGNSLRRAWVERGPAQFRAEKNLAARDQLARILFPLEVHVTPELLKAPPRAELRDEQNRELWSWLASRYRYESRDLDGSTFFAEAASEYERYATLAPQAYVEITGCSGVPTLSLATPSADCTLLLRIVAASAKPRSIEVRILKPDQDPMRVILAGKLETDGWRLDSDGQRARYTPPVANLVAPLTVPLLLHLDAQAAGQNTPILGLLVQVRIDGRTFHSKVSTLFRPTTDHPELLIAAENGQEPSTPPEELRLRPIKSPQAYFLFVRNPTRQTRQLQVDMADDTAPIKGASVKLSVPANATTPVAFGSAPQTPKELPEVRGPMRIRLLDTATGEEIQTVQMRLSIASPREYVRVNEIQFTPSVSLESPHNRLGVQLAPLRPIAPPPCHVELILPRDRIPGLLNVQDGNLAGNLPAGGGVLNLYADRLLFLPGTDMTGYFFLNVDGLERAFRFRSTFARSGGPVTPQEDDQPDLRLRAPAFALASNQFAFDVEADSPPPGATLEVSLGRLINGTFLADLSRALPEARRRRLGLGLQGPGGALLFSAAIQDWQIEFDTSKVLGSRELRARLLDSTGTIIRTATKQITLDDTPPDNVAFLDLPSQVLRDVALTVQATGTDSISGVQQVLFFLGKPVDGKLPPNAVTVRGQALDPVGIVWSGKLPLPPDKKGPTEISVQFTNQVGMSSFATATVDVLESNPTKLGPGSIQGAVYEGTRPQSGLVVSLKDAKGTTKDTMKTGADGSFSFANLAPGKYTLSASKLIAQRQGEVTAVVEPNQTARVRIDLYIQSP